MALFLYVDMGMVLLQRVRKKAGKGEERKVMNE